MIDLQIKGADDLDALAKRLKAAGDGGLRRELLARIRTATKPIAADVRSSALSQLPRSGGLAARVAASKMSTRTRTSGNNVGVRFEARSLDNLRRMDAGTVRHPVFGRRKSWTNQAVEPGFFSEPIEKVAPDVRDAVQDAMRDVANKITKTGAL